MKELLKAIKTAYNTDDGESGDFTLLRAANTGGLYTEEQRQGQAKPYIVLHHLGGTSTYAMGDVNRVRIKDSTVQFSFYSATIATLMDITNLFGNAFDDLTLSYDNMTPIVMEQVDEGKPEKELDYWTTTIDYRIMRTGTVSGAELIEHLYNLISIV